MQIEETKLEGGSQGAVGQVGQGYAFTSLGEFPKTFPNWAGKDNKERFFRW
jgi:hypothetical protein